MGYPVTRVELAFSASPYNYTPTWVDVTGYVRNVSIRRGRANDLEQFPTGTATVVFDNRDRRFDPMNTAGPYYGDLVPRVQIRITADAGAGYVDVFRGYVAGWPVQITNAGFDSTSAVECFDILGLLAEQETLADVPLYFGKTVSGGEGLRFRLNEAPGETELRSLARPNFPFPTPILPPSRMVQIAGPTSFSTFDPLAPAFSYSSVNIGVGNAWQRLGTDFQNFQTTPVGQIACWLASNTPGFSSYSLALNAIHRVFFRFDVNGNLVVEQYDSAGTPVYQTISNGVEFAGFTPHHVVYSDGGSGPLLFIDGRQVGYTTSLSGSPPYTVDGYGVIRLDNHVFQDVIWNGETTTLRRDANQARQWAAEVYGSAVGNVPETTNAKAARVLDYTPVVAAWRTFDTNPESTLGAQGAQQPVLTELQRIADSEGGEVFATKANQVRLTNRSTAAANAAGTAAAVFTDTGANLPYGPELSIALNADNIINRLNVTFAGGGQITQDIAASITANGVAEQTVDTYLATKQGAIDYAAHQAGTYANPVPEYSPLEVSVTDNAAHWQTVLGLELLDKITVTVTPKTGAAFTQPLTINAVTHDITPAQWTSTITGSARHVGWFVVGRSLIGGPDLLV